MDEFAKDVTIHVLATEAKKNYRDLLVYRLFAQLLKINNFEDTVEKMLDDARQSTDVQKSVSAYEASIDAMISPSVSDRLDEAIQKALEALPPAKFQN